MTAKLVLYSCRKLTELVFAPDPTFGFYHDGRTLENMRNKEQGYGNCKTILEAWAGSGLQVSRKSGCIGYPCWSCLLWCENTDQPECALTVFVARKHGNALKWKSGEKTMISTRYGGWKSDQILGNGGHVGQGQTTWRSWYFWMNSAWMWSWESIECDHFGITQYIKNWPSNGYLKMVTHTASLRRPWWRTWFSWHDFSFIY